jgi:hypothetical protein
MSLIRPRPEHSHLAFEDATRPDRPRFPVISALLGMLAMMNVVSVVLTLIK